VTKGQNGGREGGKVQSREGGGEGGREGGKEDGREGGSYLRNPAVSEDSAMLSHLITQRLCDGGGGGEGVWGVVDG